MIGLTRERVRQLEKEALRHLQGDDGRRVVVSDPFHWVAHRAGEQ